IAVRPRLWMSSIPSLSVRPLHDSGIPEGPKRITNSPPTKKPPLDYYSGLPDISIFAPARPSKAFERGRMRQGPRATEGLEGGSVAVHRAALSGPASSGNRRREAQLVEDATEPAAATTAVPHSAARHGSAPVLSATSDASPQVADGLNRHPRRHRGRGRTERGRIRPDLPHGPRDGREPQHHGGHELLDLDDRERGG